MTETIRLRVKPALIPQNATLEVGTVTTLPPGTPATVTNTGTPEAAVFDFGIPEGADGDPGTPGVVQSVVGGSGVTVDSTDPANPIVSASGAVSSVNGASGDVVLDAGDIGVTPAGGIAATDVQAALQELDTEKQPASANLDEYAAVNPTAAGLALLDDANAAAQLVTLGLTATAAELNALDGITATVTELNYTDGVTSAIQSQIDAKVTSAGGSSSATVVTSTGSTTARTLAARFADVFNAKDFGVVANGSTNDTSAMVAAFAAAQTAGVPLILPPGVIMCDPDVLAIGNGSNSAGSTTNGFALLGVGCTPYNPTAGTVIKARGAGTNLLEIKGQINGIKMDGILFDCDGVVGNGLRMYSVSNSSFTNLGVMDFTGYGINLNCRTYAPGSVGWATNNTFEQIFLTSDVVVDFGAGIVIDGYYTNAYDWHHCTFTTITVQVNKGATNPTYGALLKFTDSNTFIECDFGPSATGAATNVAAQFSGTSNASYPQNNFFYGCSIKNTGVDGTITPNTFINFCTKDGETVPTDANLKGTTDQGVFFGNWGTSVEAITLNFTFATPGNLAKTFSSQQAVIIKTGKVRKLMFNLVTSAFTHTTASGSLQITGLPEAVSAAWGTMFIGNLQFAGITKATYTQFMIRAEPSQTYCAVLASGSGVAASAVAAADMPTGGAVTLRGQVEYLVD